MKSKPLTRFFLISFLMVATIFGLAKTSQCQTTGDAATLVVSGRVVNVFRSASSNNDYLVQILAQKSEAAELDDLKRSVRFPAPGEYVYVHVSGSGREAASLPRPNMNVRAILSSGDQQQWLGRRRTWFTEIGESNPSVAKSDGDFGVSTTTTSLRFRRALKVTAVTANSPAAKVGLEVGDVLVSANGVDIETPEQLAAEVRKTTGTLKLTVRDVRSDKNVPIEVDLGSRPGTAMPTAGNTGRARVKSGLKTEVAFFSGNAVLKVTDVGRGSPAQRAGIKTGLLILTANGKAVGKPETLASAERNSKGVLTLKLVDPKSREQSTVQVDLR